MRIAQVAPLFESVPPQWYGGTERVVSYLTEELVRAGHDVTLYAGGDSRTRARLIPMCRRGLRLDPECREPVAHHIRMVERVVDDADLYDVIHWHIDLFHLPSARRLPVPHLTTLHGRLDYPDLVPLYREFHDIPVVSISDAQRAPLPMADWVATVYHGLPADLHSFHPTVGRYLAFLGRICPEKGPDRAIAIARRAGVPLKIAAKVDKADRDYHREVVAPLIAADPGTVEFVGEIGGPDKDAFLGNAAALLFPIDWPEPFGLVMIEAMATGTPVIAFGCGSVPEVVADGVSGFVVRDIDEAVAAVGRIAELDRRAVRADFLRRFTARRMAADYLAAYQAVSERRLPAGAASR